MQGRRGHGGRRAHGGRRGHICIEGFVVSRRVILRLLFRVRIRARLRVILRAVFRVMFRVILGEMLRATIFVPGNVPVGAFGNGIPSSADNMAPLPVVGRHLD